MRKNFGQQTWFYPMPVLIIGTYDENGNADAMNAAWGGIYNMNKVVLCLTPSHKTTKNIKLKKAFTVSFADASHVKEADYVGLVSGNSVPDKLERANLHTQKSEFTDAPIITEFPLTLECKLEKINEDGNIIGEIVNVSVDDRVLDKDGKIDTSKLQAISYDGANHTYIKLDQIVGNAFEDGKKIK